MDAYLEQALVPLEERASEARDVAIVTEDGFSLAATLFAPRTPASHRRLVVLNSAMGVPRRYYAAFARYLAAHGLHVVTYDYRGIGESRRGPVRALHARLRDWGERDFAAVLKWGEDELGVASPLVVGHSVGGQIVGLAANNARVQKLLLVGSQSGDYRLWPARSRAAALVFWFGVVGPVTRVFGYLPGAVLGGESVPGGVAREWSRWARRRGYMVGGKDGARARGFERLTAPILALSFADDGFAPAPAVDALLALYRGAEKVHRHFTPADLGPRGVGHFGFFRSAERERLWPSVRDWLLASRAAEPFSVS